MWHFIIFSIIPFFILLFSTILIFKKNIKKTKSKKLAPFGYRLFYTDQNTKVRKPKIIYKKILYSEKYNIQGKPDFIYKKFNKCYVVELKSGCIKDDPMPHKGDLMQLIAYFLILEDLGYKVKKGKLIYKDYSFVVKNSRRLKREFLSILKNMRIMLKTGDGQANCSFSHCRYCMCKNTVCDFYKKL